LNFYTQLEVKTTADNPDDVNWSHQAALIKVDMSIYSKDNPPSSNQPLDMAKLEAFLEFKLDLSHTGFDDKDGALFEKDTEESRHTRGQLATYAGAMMASQFRTHVFCIEVAGKMARLIRIDREAAIVTNGFCWYEEPHLVDFLWRFDYADRAIRGHDPSVRPADILKDEARAARDMLPLCSRHRVLWKFEIHDERMGKMVVLYALVDTHGLSVSPFGRYTRGFIAITAYGKKVWLKETWRIYLDDMKKEGEIYAKLHERGVPHILTVVAHGDARVGKGVQKTVSLIIPDFFKKFPSIPLRPFCHYYIVFEEVGRPLDTFNTTWEFVNALKDGMEGEPQPDLLFQYR
jgi:hypothetical protein